MISIRNMLKIIRHLSILFTLFFCYILPLFFGILVIYTESEVRNKLDCFLNVFFFRQKDCSQPREILECNYTGSEMRLFSETGPKGPEMR